MTRTESKIIAARFLRMYDENDAKYGNNGKKPKNYTAWCEAAAKIDAAYHLAMKGGK